LRNDIPEFVYIIGLHELIARFRKLIEAVLVCKEVWRANHPVKPIDDKPVLAPKNLKILVPEPIEMVLEVVVVPVDRALRCFG
jgi:hypothetical protein